MKFLKSRIDQYKKFKLLFNTFPFLKKVTYQKSTSIPWQVDPASYNLTFINNFELDCSLNDCNYFLNEFKMEDPNLLKMIMFELKIKSIKEFYQLLFALCNFDSSIFLNKKELDLTINSIDNEIILMEQQWNKIKKSSNQLKN